MTNLAKSLHLVSQLGGNNFAKQGKSTVEKDAEIVMVGLHCITLHFNLSSKPLKLGMKWTSSSVVIDSNILQLDLIK